MEDETLRPALSPTGPNPFSSAQRDIDRNNKSKKWEKPSAEDLQQIAKINKQRALTARMIRKLNSTPTWKGLANTGAASYKTTQQQRIAVARHQKEAEMSGTFKFSYPLQNPNAPVRTYVNKAYSPKPQDTYETVGYGRDDNSTFAKPDQFDEKQRKYARRQAKARRLHEHEHRIWKYRQARDKAEQIQQAARARGRLLQRDDYLRRAAMEGDRIYKSFIGRKGLYDSEMSQRQRFGNMRHYGDLAADWHERYSGGVNIPL